MDSRRCTIFLAIVCAGWEVLSAADPTTPVSIGNGNAITQDGCKSTKGCVFLPPNCTPPNCQRGLTYRRNNDYIDFELLAKLPSPTQGQFAAIGFSDDTEMGNDAVTACLYSPSTGKVTGSLFYNPGKSNQAITDKNLVNDQLTEVSGSVTNGVMSCRFSQKIKAPTSGAGSQQIYSLDKDYYILFATGPSKDGQNLEPHSMAEGTEFFPSALSSSKFSLTTSNLNATQGAQDAGQSGPTGRPLWKKQLVMSHGILMIFGWWLLVASAILYARYFKSMLPTRQMCGLDYWFHFHRGLNIIGVLAIAAAFVCIFVAEDGKWVGVGVPSSDWYPGVTHAIVGMTASIGAFIQPIMAIFRCDKHNSKRPIFNWIHRIIGMGSWGCASAAIWLASEFMPSLKTDGHYGITPRALMIFYWASLGLVMIGLEIWITLTERLRSRSAVNTDIQLRTINGKTVETTATPSNRFWFIRTILIIFFVMVAIAVTVALACFIALPNGL